MKTPQRDATLAEAAIAVVKIAGWCLRDIALLRWPARERWEKHPPNAHDCGCDPTRGSTGLRRRAL